MTSNRLPTLAAEIAAEHQMVEKASEDFVLHAIEAGRRLLEAKELVVHGQWQDWLQQHVPTVSTRTAQRYMRAAKRTAKNDNVSFSTLKEIIEDPADDGGYEVWAAEMTRLFRDAEPEVQQWFLDVVEIVGTGRSIPAHILRTEPKVIHKTADTLRQLRRAA